jgi:hypothetical protein
MSQQEPWGDKGPGKNDPPPGTRAEVSFTLDDLLAPAIEKELVRRGWSKKYAVVNLSPLMRDIGGGQSTFDGVRVTLERSEEP